MRIRVVIQQSTAIMKTFIIPAATITRAAMKRPANGSMVYWSVKITE